MISARNLSKRFGRHTAVERVSFEVEKGEILGFIGPNGAGKTTTMRMLTGFLPASDGAAVVAGHDVFDEPMAVRRAVGYLPETPPLYPELTSGLDPAQVVGIRDFIRSLAIDRTVIVSTHILTEVELLCRRAVIIARGKLLADDTLDGLRDRVGAGLRYRVELGAPEGTHLAAEVSRLPQVTSVSPLPDVDGLGALELKAPEDPRTAVARLATERGWTIRAMERVVPSLEEAFLSIVGSER